MPRTVMSWKTAISVLPLAIALLLVAAAAPAVSTIGRHQNGTASVHVAGSDTATEAARGFMRTINRGQYQRARRYAFRDPIATGRRLRGYGFRFTRLVRCYPGDRSLWECLAYFKRRRDGLEGSAYLEIDGTPGYLKIVSTAISYGD